MQVDKLSQELIKMERLYKVIRSHDGNICTSYIVAKSKQAVMKEYAQLGDILSITNISTKHYVRQSSIMQVLQDAGYSQLDIYYIIEILRKHCNSYIAQ